MALPVPHFNLAALIRGQLKDPSLDLLKYEGDREARVCNSIPGIAPRGGLKLPYERPQAAGQQVGDFGKGGAVSPVAPIHVAEAVRPDTVLERLGARRMELDEGWAGKQIIAPSRCSYGWLNETEGTTTETEITFGGTSLAPRELNAEIKMSRRLLKARNAEDVILEAFRVAISQAVETATLAGSGRNGEPLGIINITAADGINRQHLLDAVPTFAEVMAAAQQALDGGAPLNRLAFCFSAADHYALQQVERTGGRPMIEQGTGGRPMIEQGTIAGRPVAFTPHLPQGRAIVGDWSQVVMAYQGPPSLLVNPFTRANFAQTSMTIYQFFDAGVQRPASFTILEAN